MRELRFRVWDSTPGYELMTASVSLADIENGFNVSGKNRAVMQFTGLTDRNGVEIYEGDIVQPAVMGDGNIDSYRMSEDGSKAVPLPYEVKWGRYNGWDIPSETEYWVVIGNIYENPELLEANQ